METGKGRSRPIPLSTDCFSSWAPDERAYLDANHRRSSLAPSLDRAITFLLGAIVTEHAYAAVLWKRVWYLDYGLNPLTEALKVLGGYAELTSSGAAADNSAQ